MLDVHSLLAINCAGTSAFLPLLERGGNMGDKQDNEFEVMDPDFGRGVLVGPGYGSISDEDYSELVNELEK